MRIEKLLHEAEDNGDPSGKPIDFVAPKLPPEAIKDRDKRQGRNKPEEEPELIQIWEAVDSIREKVEETGKKISNHKNSDYWRFLVTVIFQHHYSLRDNPRYDLTSNDKEIREYSRDALAYRIKTHRGARSGVFKKIPFFTKFKVGTIVDDITIMFNDYELTKIELDIILAKGAPTEETVEELKNENK